jgi:Glycosyltransferase family 87
LKQPALLLLLLLGSTSMLFYWTRLPHTSPLGTNNASLIKARTLTDLYPRWYGARELLLHHRDPYSADVTREIQLAYGGMEQRFAYPLYVIFLVAPTVRMQFHSAQIVFWWFLAAVTTLSLELWLSIVHLDLSPLARITLFATVLFSVPVLQGLGLLQFGLLVAALLSGTAAAIFSGHLFLAGVLLALATIKPPMCLLAVLWFLLWISGDWHRRRPLLVGFATTLTALILASEFLVPGWAFHYRGVLAAYAKYAAPTPLVGVFLPDPLSWPVAIAGLLAVALFCWRVRRQPAGSPHFIFALALVLTLTVVIIPTALPPFNHLLVLPAALLILHHWTDLWLRGSLPRLVVSLLIGIATLPWLLAFIMTLALLMSIRPWSVRIMLLPLYASLALPIAALCLLLLLVRTLPSISPDSRVPPITAESRATTT